MAAVIDLRTGDHLVEAPSPPRLRLVSGGSASIARPASVPQVSARTYLVRRILAVAAAALLVLLVANVLAGVGRVVLGSFDGAPAASGHVHVVEAGDTAWELAARYAPELDRRVAVDDLLALNGQASMRVGQVLQLPESFG